MYSVSHSNQRATPSQPTVFPALMIGTLNTLHTPYYVKYCRTTVESEAARIDGCRRGGLLEVLPNMAVLAVQEYPRNPGAIRDFFQQAMPRHVVAAPFHDVEGSAVLYDPAVFSPSPGSAPVFHPLPEPNGNRTPRGFTIVRLQGLPGGPFAGGALTVVSCHMSYRADTEYLLRTLRHIMTTAVAASNAADEVVIAGDFNCSRDGELGLCVRREAHSGGWLNWL